MSVEKKYLIGHEHREKLLIGHEHREKIFNRTWVYTHVEKKT